MVGVEVGEQQQRDPADAQFAQAPVGEPGIGAHVDDDTRAPSRGEHQGVALPDVFPVKLSMLRFMSGFSIAPPTSHTLARRNRISDCFAMP